MGAKAKGKSLSFPALGLKGQDPIATALLGSQTGYREPCLGPGCLRPRHACFSLTRGRTGGQSIVCGSLALPAPPLGSSGPARRPQARQGPQVAGHLVCGPHAG